MKRGIRRIALNGQTKEKIKVSYFKEALAMGLEDRQDRGSQIDDEDFGIKQKSSTAED